jgi:uncharacterized membrane protein YesL
MGMFGGLDYNNLGGTLGADQEDRTSRGYTWRAIVDNVPRLFITNLICVIAMIPALTGFTLGSMWERPQVLLLSGIVGGLIAAPFYAAMYDAALMSYRGYPGRWWERYVKVLKREWRGSLIPGMIVGLIAAMVINVVNNLYSGNRLPDMMIICVVVMVVVVLAIYTYLWTQRLMVDLSLPQIVKNCWLMTMMHPLITLGTIALRAGYWALMLILYPYSLVFLVMLGVWFPAFMTIRIMYNTLDKAMQLDERYEQAQQAGEDA